ncbi:MAG: hypothetical protein II724_07930 [Clostridia bacterium]|nr:hypothetical protein [Clostridia bacterium]
MKKHLLRIIAAALAVALILALPGCDLLVPVTGEYRILSVNDVGVNRFFADDSVEGAAFIESLGFGEDTGFAGPVNEIMTIGLESGGTGYVTKLGFITYAVWSEADDIITVTCESGEILVLEHIPGSSAVTYLMDGYYIVFSKM